jgi:serine/threonine-protein kinase
LTDDVAWTARLRAWLVPPLPPDLEDAFGSEIAERNRLRLLVVAPFVLVGHAIHVAIYRTSAVERASLSPLVAEWRDAVAVVHAATFVVTLTLALLLVRSGRGRAARLIPPAAVLVYLLHGAVTAGVDQLSTTVTGVAPFIAYCLFFAVFITLRPPLALVLYGVAAAAFYVALTTMQSSPSVRLALMPNGASIVVVSVILSWVLYTARRRDFGQRVTIDRQRESLSALNTSLEGRVRDQVSEIVKRAEEVDHLNAQLRAQVRERSMELSIALAKLAQDRELDGSLRPGALLGDRFEIGHLLGKGGMGVVYEGVDRTTGARVAIKVIQAGSSQQLAALRRFLREAKAGAMVAHPAIVRVLHVDVSDDGLFYQVLELVEGDPLHSGQHPWDPGAVARLGSVLCSALAAAHEHGVVHCDVKPSNILLTKTSPGMKLLDFGIARLYEEGHAPDDGAGTATGVILGTPGFMSPEQVEGMQGLTAAADVYSVGILLFLLLTGAHPFARGRTMHGLVFGHLCVPAPDVRTFVSTVPELLAELVAYCLEKDPQRRPTALRLGSELAALADEREVGPLEELARRGAQETVMK